MRILFLLLLFVTSNYTQDNVEFFDPTQLKKGMKGYGLTVFSGEKPEKMDAEIIAYMPNRFPKSGMVLVQFSGENVEKTGIAAGMSGSPIYIDGKLVGALAYGWSFSKALLAGIIPIQDMVGDKQRGINTSYALNKAIPINTAWAMEGFTELDINNLMKDTTKKSEYQQGIEQSITVPSSRSNGYEPFKAGDAVAIKLVEGDLNLAAIGTVTHVDGEDVYIFGHPFDGEGPISLPLARAEIYHIMPNLDNSFKMGRALETVGATVFDGMYSVQGRLDKKALMVPVKINIIAKDYTNNYFLNIARSRKYLPKLLGRGLGSILDKELGKNIERQIDVSWKLNFTNQQIVSNSVTWVKDTVYEPGSIAAYWENYISILWQNSLTHLVPEQVELNIDITDRRYDYYMVESVVLDRKEYIPGETININIAMKKYLSNSMYTNITLQLPKKMEEGQYSLVVGSALAIERELIAIFPEKYSIRSEQQLLQELRRDINSQLLQAVVIDSQDGSIIGTSFFGNIPKSRQSLFNSKYNTGENILAPKLYTNNIYMDLPVLGGTVKVVDIIVPQPRDLTQLEL